MIPLAGRDSIPVWDQVTQGLLQLLRKGAFLPGEALPSPEELARKLVLNPVAVRRAYAALEDRGLLLRREAGYTVTEGGGDVDQSL